MHAFVDQAEIQVASGKGGAGCVSFRREKYEPRGGPDGGDGGRGGDVVLRAMATVKTLTDVKRLGRFRAGNGQTGMGRKRSGAKGKDVVIALPPGTLVSCKETGQLLIDLQEAGQEYVVARGGKGGQGNQHFATSVNQAPRYAQPGLPGEERFLHLELKLIADIGLVGLPNAGKSTLLKALTRARPRIAAYPFTTLSPNLGVVRLDQRISYVIADIPGIIAGASQGKGLGLDFLRHIERTRLLVLVIDFFSDDPRATEQLLLGELAAFSPALIEKPMLRVANKTDLAEAREKASDFPAFLPISGAAHSGLDALLAAVRQQLEGTT